MPNQPSLNLIPTVQQAIGNLLLTYEPEFIRFGFQMFMAFATIIIVWQGIRMMFSHDGLGEQMFDFAKLLLFVSFGYALITFYEAPLPGIGVSFSNLITDQAHHFQSILEARAFDNIYRHLDELADHYGSDFQAAAEGSKLLGTDSFAGTLARENEITLIAGTVRDGRLYRIHTKAAAAKAEAAGKAHEDFLKSFRIGS